MANFVVIGSSNDNSAARQAVFREIREGSVENAHYVGIDALFRGSRSLYRALTSRKLKVLARKNRVLNNLLSRAISFFYLRERSVNIRSLTPYLSNSEENYLIFCPGTRIDRISGAFLTALRARCPRCHLIYYFVDSIERTAFMNRVDINFVLDYIREYDAAYTYDRADAELYRDDVQFIEIPLWRTSTPAPAEPTSDLYFCGHDKNRRDLLLAVYDRLQGAGLRCHYRIVTSVKENHPRLGVTLSDWTPYEITAGEVTTANCVLEILAVHNRESTLRYKEAVMYNKKFLTTNPAISDLPYYDSRWMRTFQTEADIDLDWLHAVEPVDYGYRGDYSAETFLNRVEELTKNAKT